MFIESFICGQVWAVDERHEALMGEIMWRRIIMGERISKDEFAAISYEVPVASFLDIECAPEADAYADGFAPDMLADNGAVPAQGQKIAVINVMGPISQRTMGLSGPSAGSTENIGQAFDAAVADPQVKAIVLRVDSPGGAVSGVPELAQKISQARGSKPIVASVDSLAASAAYWLASAADQISVTPSGQVGSIGVFVVHQDVSEAMKKQGVAATLVSRGRFKTENNRFAAMTGDGRAALQSTVDGYYDHFAKDVAKNRSTSTKAVSADDVEKGYGEGRTLRAPDAVKANLADRIETFDQTVKRLGARSGSVKPRMAANSNQIGIDTAAAYFLPVATDEQMADAGTMTVHMENGEIASVVQHKKYAVLQPAIINTHIDKNRISIGAGKVHIKTSADVKSYAISAVTKGGELLILPIASGTLPDPEAKVSTPAPRDDPEGNAFRRRKHNHRMRMASA